MTYSDTALAFSVLPAGHQVRLEDRVSFAYLEYAAVVQDRTGVVGLKEDLEDGYQRIRILLPVAGLAVLALGPGTSITHPALTSCTRSGATVLFCGGGGIPAYSHATALTSSARWALAQAKVITHENLQLEAAIKLYKRQLGIEMPGGSISTLRGVEGRTIRDLYRQLAKQYKVDKFKREVEGLDPVNVGLNIGNSILYGAAASACAAIGVNPALGFIHRGDARSLLFDLADLYKPTLSIPVAFRCAHESPEELPAAVRRAVRSELVRQKVLAGMLDALMEVLQPHLPRRNDDRLVDDAGEVPGHRLYGRDDDASILIDPGVEPPF